MALVEAERIEYIEYEKGAGRKNTLREICL